MIFGMAIAQDDQLNILFQQQVGYLGQQIPSLLGIKPTDLGEHRDVRPLGEAGLPLEPGLALGLALGDGGRVIRGGQHRLVLRRPGLDVDPVDDPAQVGRSVAEQVLQPRSQSRTSESPGRTSGSPC